MQESEWRPIINWAIQRFQIDVAVTTGVLPLKQSKNTEDVLTKHLSQFSPLKLAGIWPLQRVLCCM
jgi:chaperone required for assembly of F1-ATPase